jgi:hypothetical protein
VRPEPAVAGDGSETTITENRPNQRTHYFDSKRRR